MKNELSVLPRRPGVGPSVKFFLFDNEKRSFREVRHGMICGRTGVDLTCSGDPLVSRRQCGFVIVGSEIYVEAFSSTNPTRVNSVLLVPGRRRRIRLDDVIEFGGQRLTLTYQNRFPPSNVVDPLGRRARYRAVRKEDGSLTSTVTGQGGDRTQVLLDRAQYRRLQVRKALKPVVRPVLEKLERPSRTRVPLFLFFLSLVFGLVAAWPVFGAK